MKALVRKALIAVNVIKYDENCHKLIDVSLLQSIPDCEILKCRNIGKCTLEAIKELRKTLDWIE